MLLERSCFWINLAQSAQKRHETYVGTWLPEPVDTSTDPGLGAERSEALKPAVLLLLEKLSPTERAAYVLREAFDYSYDQIASILQMEEANVRQLVSRKHIIDGRRKAVSSSEQRRLLDAFVTAAQKGDMAALEELLAEDVVAYADGGGLVRAAGVPVSGRERVKALFEAVSKYIWKGVSVDFVEVNGQAAVLVSRDGVPAMLGTIDASAQGIDQIMWFMRPSKLTAVSKSGQDLSEGHAPGPTAAWRQQRL